MLGKTTSRLLALLIVAIGSCPMVAHATAPWDKFIGGSVEADPKKSYDLTAENGPWMVLACSFSGPDADKQAKDLAFELRKNFKLPAYVYKKRFDFGKAEALGVDRFNRPLKPKYLRGLDQVEETAVLVGNCRAIDEPDAKDLLQKIKTIQPECLKVEKDQKTSRTAWWQAFQQANATKGSELKKEGGALSHAFLTTNPLLPKDYFKGVSQEVVKLNNGIEYSLLDCRGKYTVRVAHFEGNVVINQKDIRAIENGEKSMKSSLDAAAEAAHLLTKALRKDGFEAYEFHDLRSSIVTVGSFNSLDAPKIREYIKRFGNEQAQMAMPGESMQTQGKAWKVEGNRSVPFDIAPIPIEVPRRSIVADYRRDTAGRR